MLWRRALQGSANAPLAYANGYAALPIPNAFVAQDVQPANKCRQFCKKLSVKEKQGRFSLTTIPNAVSSQAGNGATSRP